MREAMLGNAELVPAFAFGENDLFDQVHSWAAIVSCPSLHGSTRSYQFSNEPGTLVRSVQDGLQKLLGFTLPFVKHPLPRARTVTVVVGPPMSTAQLLASAAGGGVQKPDTATTAPPTKAAVLAALDGAHARYLEALTQLHDEHRLKFPLHGGHVSQLKFVE